MQAIVLMRQETINMRMKWQILKQAYRQAYRYGITEHGCVLRAVTVVVQIAIKNGEPLFQVDYHSDFKQQKGDFYSTNTPMYVVCTY